ncbi:MAG: hypothetical protein QM725_12390 [Lacibacter sp.]
MMHFMRSIYAGGTEKEGFEIRRMLRTENQEKIRIQQLYKEHYQKKIKNGNEIKAPFPPDSTKYYEEVLAQKDFIEQISVLPVPYDSVACRLDSITVELKFSNYLHILYNRSKEDPDYVGYFSGYSKPKHPSSYMTLLQKESSLYIFPDGSYYEVQNVINYGYWAWSERLSRMLPFDFKPSP